MWRSFGFGGRGSPVARGEFLVGRRGFLLWLRYFSFSRRCLWLRRRSGRSRGSRRSRRSMRSRRSGRSLISGCRTSRPKSVSKEGSCSMITSLETQRINKSTGCVYYEYVGYQMPAGQYGSSERAAKSSQNDGQEDMLE